MSHDISSTWYANFFTELPNEFWRRAATPESTEADVDFVERHLGLRPGARVLDAPCGSGRHTLALAARGHRLTGVDISAEAIGYARRAAADAQHVGEGRVAQIRVIPRDGAVDAPGCRGNNVG
ncbi:class I SAM-dependent methyltransferase, partial [Streptosporangium sp. NPDC002524]|uniref:SAM-dependent methyltransferase n=1 Tax=Streptosporangium sp. NPDC002524 TaxID=3154537 RepID=UPI00332751F4